MHSRPVMEVMKCKQVHPKWEQSQAQLKKRKGHRRRSSRNACLAEVLTIENVDQLLQAVDPAKDRDLWVKEHKTGDVRPIDLDI
ncbi:unnamed protein product [Arctogadus glacialis]